MKLIKLSAPGWEKDFENEEDLIEELRSNICSLCLYTDESEYSDPVDVVYDGVLYECRDLRTLLGTACGCEFTIEEEEDEEEIS